MDVLSSGSVNKHKHSEAIYDENLRINSEGLGVEANPERKTNIQPKDQNKNIIGSEGDQDPAVTVNVTRDDRFKEFLKRQFGPNGLSLATNVFLIFFFLLMLLTFAITSFFIHQKTLLQQQLKQVQTKTSDQTNTFDNLPNVSRNLNIPTRNLPKRLHVPNEPGLKKINYIR